MPPYTTAHADPQGPGDARPTAMQIIEDNGMRNQLIGKVIVITGVSSGIGVETSLALKTTGARVIGTARDVDKARAALTTAGADNIELVQMDQSSFESVRAGAKEIFSKTDAVSILIANAGVMAVPTLQKSKDGFELHLATNHLSHFLLFQLLLPAIRKGSAPDFQSRVVFVGAGWHRAAGIAPEGDYNFERSEYDPWIAYARSKTANTYMANEIERQYGERGIHATSLHPGVILSTGVARHVPAQLAEQARGLYQKMEKSAAQGAATTVYAAIGKDWEGRGGRYLVNCDEAEQGEDNGNPGDDTFVTHTYNEEEEARLWKDSLYFIQ